MKLFIEQTNLGFWKTVANVLFKDGRGSLLVTGLLNTFIITFGAIAIGIFIGTFLAIFKVLPKDNTINRVLSAFSDIYLTVIRGTPIIVQLAIFYFVVFAGIGIDPLIIAVIGFGINSGAYVAELMRSGIQTVDKGQLEAGQALGLKYSAIMLKVILPQAIKNIIPALGNELISLIKETSVASVVTVTDFFNACKYITSSSYNFQIPYIFAAIVYLVIIMILTQLIKLIERRLRKSDRRS